MIILIVHNSYQEPGGEDIVVDQEIAMLRAAGHRVIEYRRSNSEVNAFRLKDRMLLPKRIIWAGDSIRDIKKLLVDVKPDIVHVHNTFFLISPGVYYALSSLGIPVVKSLQNYRLLCPAAIFYRDGKICEDCLHKSVPYPSVLHRCYHTSSTASIAVASMLTTHNFLRTWKEHVDLYIAVTEFLREKFIEGGFPAGRIRVKPNVVMPDPGCRTNENGYAVFAGRLVPEKGLWTLLEAWRRLKNIPLKIFGAGHLLSDIQEVKRDLPLVEIMGFRPHEEIFQFLKGARCLIFPSQWFEGFPLAIAEAFACGVPVIASRLGGMAEIIQDGRTGLLFTPGDANDLVAKVQWAWSHHEEMTKMGQEARKAYEEKFSPQRNYQTLMEIYELAIQMRRSRAQATAGR